MECSKVSSFRTVPCSGDVLGLFFFFASIPARRSPQAGQRHDGGQLHRVLAPALDCAGWLVGCWLARWLAWRGHGRALVRAGAQPPCRQPCRQHFQIPERLAEACSHPRRGACRLRVISRILHISPSQDPATAINRHLTRRRPVSY